MSEIPSVVYEGTNIEIVRKEGSTISAKVIGTLAAGNVVGSTSSGLVLAVNSAVGLADGQLGVALFQGTSGQRVTAIKGKVRALWDGATGTATPTFGTPIGISATQSGFWEVSASTSGAAVIGYYFGTGAGTAAPSSGQLGIVVIQ